MPESVYILCTITSGLCAWLLTRGYWRTRDRLLLWSSWCFVFLAISNVLLAVDLALLPDSIDLSVARTVPAVIGVGLMLFGLIWEAR